LEKHNGGERGKEKSLLETRSRRRRFGAGKKVDGLLRLVGGRLLFCGPRTAKNLKKVRQRKEILVSGKGKAAIFLSEKEDATKPVW